MFDFFNKKKKLELKDNSVVTVQFKADPFGEVDKDVTSAQTSKEIPIVRPSAFSNNINKNE